MSDQIPEETAKPPAPAALRALLEQFIERTRELRNGSPNAFYQHVDAFCWQLERALPPAETSAPQPQGIWIAFNGQNQFVGLYVHEAEARENSAYLHYAEVKGLELPAAPPLAGRSDEPPTVGSTTTVVSGTVAATGMPDPHITRCTPGQGHFMRFGDQQCECGEQKSFQLKTAPPTVQPAGPTTRASDPLGDRLRETFQVSDAQGVLVSRSDVEGQKD